MPNFNPFSNNDDDTSFEHGLPVSQAAKTVTKAASSQVSAQTNAAVKKATDDVLDFLYAPSTLQEPGTDETNTQHTDQSNAATRAVASSQTAAHKSANTNQNSNITPDDQTKMEKIRRELEANYSNKFQSAPNGAQNITTNLEQEMEKARQERKQKEMQRKQEEEEEEKRKKEEEERQKEEFAMPAGKKTGFQMGKKQQQPMAVHLSRIKTEGNRGTSG